MRTTLRTTLLIAALCSTHPASAQSDAVGGHEFPLPSALLDSYVVAASCPDAASFESAVRQRVAEPRGSLRVRVEAAKAGFSGTIERVEGESVLGRREVRDESCAQVIEALALVGALLVSPPPSEPAPANSAPSAASSANRAPEPQPTLARRDAKLELPPPAGQVSGAHVGRRALPFWHGPAIGVAAQDLVAPEVVFGPRLAYRVGVPHRLLESEVSLGWTRTQSGTLDVEGTGSASLTYNAARLRFCELFPLSRTLWAAPCALVDLGELRGTGTPLGATSVTRASTWFSAGLVGKVELRLRAPLVLETSAGAVYPFMRPSFYFSVPGANPPTQAIFSTAQRLGFSADVLLSVRFL